MIDNDTKNILIVAAIGLSILWLAKKAMPANESIIDIDHEEEGPSADGKYGAPKVADVSKRDQVDNASVAIDAYASAAQAGEPKEELDKLNRILRNEQGIRVKYCGERKFKAYNNSGKVVLEKTF